MHILGKIFAWLLVPLAAVAAVLMTRELQIRNSYASALNNRPQEVAKGQPSLREEVEKNEQLLEEKRQKLAGLQRDYSVLMHSWGSVWDGKSTFAEEVGGRPTMMIQAGTNEGVGVEVTSSDPDVTLRRNTVLHLFRTQQDQSSYLGRFVLSNVGEIQPAQIRAYPDWTPRGNELADWEDLPPKSVRIRSAVPPTYDAKFTGAYVKIGQIEGELGQALGTDVKAQLQKIRQNVDQGQNVDQEQELQVPDVYRSYNNAYQALHDATEYVNRNREILAGADGTGGLVAQLRDAEEQRNAVLTRVDGLRRQSKRLVDERSDLVEKNARLVERLPQPMSDGGR